MQNPVVIHQPARFKDESQVEYRARRALSNQIARDATRTPHQQPAINQFDVARFFLGEHTNQRRNKARAIVAAVGQRQAKKARMQGVTIELI